MKKILLILAVFLHCYTAQSQEKTQSVKDTINLKEVIVTGSTTKINRNNTPLAVSVLDRKQISEGSESTILPMLSGRVPGLYVTERGVTDSVSLQAQPDRFLFAASAEIPQRVY